MAEREGLRGCGEHLLKRRLKRARAATPGAARDWDGPHADRFPAADAAKLTPAQAAEREARVLAHRDRVGREEAALRAALVAARDAGRALGRARLSPEAKARKVKKNAALNGLREARLWTACQRCGKLFRQPYPGNTPQKTCSRKCPAWAKKEAS